eukprot:1492445-Pleurochrysis_carterae.AAC.1
MTCNPVLTPPLEVLLHGARRQTLIKRLSGALSKNGETEFTRVTMRKWIRSRLNSSANVMSRST